MKNALSPKPSFKISRGFTLIELLVVIAIIGILSVVVLASLNEARKKARDTARLSDLQQLQASITIYGVANGAYPSTGNAWWGSCPGTAGWYTYKGPNEWIPNLVPNLFTNLPLDPTSTSPNACYVYRSDGTDYMLMAHGSVEFYNSASNQWTRPSYDGVTGDGCSDGGYQNNFAFYSSGAKCW